MPITYILQKIEDLTKKVEILLTEYRSFYIENIDHINDIRSIPNIKKRLTELALEQNMMKYQAKIDRTERHKLQLSRETEVFNILKKYFPEETAARLSVALKEGTLIVVTGKPEPTGKTTLCRELQELGCNVCEDWQSPIRNMDRNDNFAGIVLFLNELVI